MNDISELKVIFFEESVKVVQEDGDVSWHPLKGVVFCSAMQFDESGDTITYTNMFEHEDETTEQFRLDLEEGIQSGLWPGQTYYALVRSGIPGHWNYYPLPLLFGTEEERRESAEARGKQLPRKSWLRAKRNLVRKIARLPLGD